MKTTSFCIAVIGLTLLCSSTSAQENKSAAATIGVAAQKPLLALDVTYIGNAGFMIQAGGKKVLVDALFEGTTDVLGPLPELLVQMMDAHGPFADVDLLLVTHPHADHFNPKLVIEFLRNHALCLLVAHTQVVDRLRNEDEKHLIEMEKRYFGKLSFRADPALHAELFKIVNVATNEEVS